MRFVLVLISLLTLCRARPLPTLTGIWILETQKSQCVWAEGLTKLVLSIEPLREPGAFRVWRIWTDAAGRHVDRRHYTTTVTFHPLVKRDVVDRVILCEEGTGLIEEWVLKPEAKLIVDSPCAADRGVSHQRLTFHPADRLALVARP